MQQAIADQTVTESVKALVAINGFTKTAKLLNIGREAVLRIAGGAPVRLGTIALAEKNLQSLRSVNSPAVAL